jgi:hypothetical protein
MANARITFKLICAFHACSKLSKISQGEKGIGSVRETKYFAYEREDDPWSDTAEYLFAGPIFDRPRVFCPDKTGIWRNCGLRLAASGSVYLRHHGSATDCPDVAGDRRVRAICLIGRRSLAALLRLCRSKVRRRTA